MFARLHEIRSRSFQRNVQAFLSPKYTASVGLYILNCLNPKADFCANFRFDKCKGDINSDLRISSFEYSYQDR